ETAPEPVAAAAPPPPAPIVEEGSSSIDDLFGDIALGADFISSTPAETPAPVAEAPAPVAETPPAIETPAPAPAAEAAPAAHSLFDESNLGGDLDDIFSGLAPEAANDEFSAEKLAEKKSHHPEPAPAPAPAPEPVAQADGKLFGSG